MEPATTTQYAIDLSPILTDVIQALAVLLLALGSWAIKKLMTKLGLEHDDKIRGYLEEALLNGIEFAKKKAGDAAQSLHSIEVKDKVVADAANYVAKGVPDALRHFGITDERLKEMLLARLQ